MAPLISAELAPPAHQPCSVPADAPPITPPVTPSITPWLAQLPVLSAASVAQSNLIAARLAAGQFKLGDDLWRYRLLPLASGQAVLPSQPALELRALWGGASVRVLCPPSLPALLCAPLFPGAQHAALPEALQLAALTLTLQQLQDKLSAHGGRQLSWQSATTLASAPSAPAPGEIAFQLELDSTCAADGCTVWLLLEAPALAQLATLARALPACAPQQRPDLPLELRLELGGLRLSLSALRQLRCHDVLLPDHLIDCSAPQVWLRAGARHAVRAQLGATQLFIQSTLEEITMWDPVDSAAVDTTDYLSAPLNAALNTPLNTPLDAPAAPAAAAPALAALDALEVELRFDVGQLPMTLAALAALQPGQVLTLGTAPARLVTLRVQGRCLGHGELVRVDDQVGVRILELGQAQTAP